MSTKRFSSMVLWVPFALIGAGGLAMVVFGGVEAAIGGGALVVIGAALLISRRSLPKPDRDMLVDTSRLPLDAAVSDAENFAPLSWQKSYECGHPVIDTQHRRLFEVSNALIHAGLEGQPREHVEAMLDDLVEHIKIHFEMEEQVLARTGYPWLIEHQRAHAALLQQANSLRGRYGAGQVKLRDLVSFIAHDVIAEHIIKEDLQFALRPSPQAA